VPRTQITSAELDVANATLTVGGPFTPELGEKPFNVEVVVTQGKAYAYGHSAGLGAVQAPLWSVEAHVVNTFDPKLPAVGLGMLVSLDRTDAGDALGQVFTWTEAIQLKPVP
jgi:hypothetical protein